MPSLQKIRFEDDVVYCPYIWSMAAWNWSWIALRLSLKAAVTRPESGIQTSGQSWIFVGISNFSSPFCFP